MKNLVYLLTVMSLFLVFGIAPLAAQTTQFTYQGHLSSDGTSADGIYEFEFTLYGSIAGGSPLGSVITRNNVAVANGVFSISLDFGSEFPGTKRYLEIRVRQAGGGAYTTLAPRQEISSSPYSVRSASAATALDATMLGGIAANQYVLTSDPRMSDRRAPNGGSSFYIQNGSALQSSSNFRISGTGRALILDADDQYRLGGQRVLSANGTKNLFAGLDTGTTNTSGRDNSFFGSETGNTNQAGSQNSFFGTRGGYSNFSGSNNSYFGFEANSNNGSNSFLTLIGAGATANANGMTYSTALGADSVVSASNRIKLGRIQEKVIVPGTLRVGDIGDNSTGRDKVSLYANTGNMDLYMEGSGATVGINLGVSSGPGNPSMFISHYDGSVFLDRLIITPLGTVKINNLGPAGITSVCRNGQNELATCSSSIRYKSNINSFTPGLALIKKLRPVSFNWTEGGMLDLGLVAEEVAAAEPLLTTTVNGITEGVKYDRVGVVLVNAVQEQQVQIEAGQEEISRLKALLEKQQTEIDQLRQKQKELDELKLLVCTANKKARICK